jgi:hypothetical protein
MATSIKNLIPRFQSYAFPASWGRDRLATETCNNCYYLALSHTSYGASYDTHYNYKYVYT